MWSEWMDYTMIGLLHERGSEAEADLLQRRGSVSKADFKAAAAIL